MKEDIDILKKVGRRDGMTVPEDFFADFSSRMSESLPERSWAMPQAAQPRSLWQRVRPYAYMAAMFAGVWCMLKMFTLISSTSCDMGIDSNPILAEAVGNEEFIDEYIIDDVNQWDLMDEMMEEGFDTGCLGDTIVNPQH